jgi:hypothetical protein
MISNGAPRSTKMGIVSPRRYDAGAHRFIGGLFFFSHPAAKAVAQLKL